jgi:archaellum biogenesis ATPase FlaH
MEAKSPSKALGFKTNAEDTLGEREKRIASKKSLLSFGVSFLDDALGGIRRNDLVVIGAQTGKGKSQLAMLIALHNCRAGKNVHYFALESERHDIARRIRFQVLANTFYSDPNRPSIILDYQDWILGLLDDQLKKYEDEIDLTPLFPNLHIYYRESDFTAEVFQKIFFGIKEETDLVIVDHLHYFDFVDTNENKATKEIMKTIMDCVQISERPVVLISHVRKRDRKTNQLLPDIEDFHGSSEISKICSKAITLAHAPEELDPLKQKSTLGSKTLISILKNRTDGSRVGWVACIAYVYGSQSYQTRYALGRLSYMGDTFKESSPNDVPSWAKGYMYNP